MQMRVQEELVGSTLAELEAQVPEGLLTGMWEGVEAGLEGRSASWGDGELRSPAEGARNPASTVTFPPTSRTRPTRTWVVPTLAAATLILLFSTGFLLLETRRLASQGETLAQQVTEQQGWLAELGGVAGADPVARTAALAGRSPFNRALSRQESISIRGLILMLERMPGDRVVLNRNQVEAALRSRIPLTPPFMREALGSLDGQEEVRARDLLRALEALDVSPDLTVPTAELMALLS